MIPCSESSVKLADAIKLPYFPLQGGTQVSRKAVPMDPRGNDFEWFILDSEKKEKSIFYCRPKTNGLAKTTDNMGMLETILWFNSNGNVLAFQLDKPGRSTFLPEGVKATSAGAIEQMINGWIQEDPDSEQKFLEAFGTLQMLEILWKDKNADFENYDYVQEQVFGDIAGNTEMNAVKLDTPENGEAMLKFGGLVETHIFKIVTLAEKEYPDRNEFRPLNMNFFSIPNNQQKAHEAAVGTLQSYEKRPSVGRFVMFFMKMCLDDYFVSEAAFAQKFFSVLTGRSDISTLDLLIEGFKEDTELSGDSLKDVFSQHSRFLDDPQNTDLFKDILKEYFSKSKIFENQILQQYKFDFEAQHKKENKKYYETYLDDYNEINADNLEQFYNVDKLIEEMAGQISVDALNQLKNAYIDLFAGNLKSNIASKRFSLMNLNDQKQFMYFVRRNLAFGNIPMEENAGSPYKLVGIEMLMKLDGRLLI